MVVLYFFLSLFIAAILCVILKIWKKLFRVFEEILTLLKVMQGGEGQHHMGDKTSLKTYVFAVNTNMLDETSINEYTAFADEYIDNAKYTVSQVHDFLRKQSHVLFFRDRVSGSLRGTMFFNFIRKEDHTLFIMGTTALNYRYRGDAFLYLAPALYVIKELIRHPFTPLYIVGKAFSYKSYLFGIKMWDRFYPRYDKKTPEHLEKIMDEYAHFIIGPNDRYDPESKVIEKTGVTLKQHVAPISDTDKQNPHIKFFNERNPGWEKGNCLVMVGVLNWRSIFQTINRAVVTKIRGKKETNKKDDCYTRKSEFVKSFSPVSAHKYYVPGYEVDCFGYCRQKSAILTASPSFLHRETVSDLFASVDLDNF